MPNSLRGTGVSQESMKALEIALYAGAVVHRLLERLAVVHPEARADAAGETSVVLIEADVQELKTFLPFIRRFCHVLTLSLTSQVIPVSRRPLT